MLCECFPREILLREMKRMTFSSRYIPAVWAAGVQEELQKVSDRGGEKEGER